MSKTHAQSMRVGVSAFKLTKLIEKTINKLLLALLAACTAHALWSRCGMTICAMPTLLLLEKTSSIHMRT